MEKRGWGRGRGRTSRGLHPPLSPTRVAFQNKSLTTVSLAEMPQFFLPIFPSFPPFFDHLQPFFPLNFPADHQQYYHYHPSPPSIPSVFRSLFQPLPHFSFPFLMYLSIFAITFLSLINCINCQCHHVDGQGFLLNQPNATLLHTTPDSTFSDPLINLL